MFSDLNSFIDAKLSQSKSVQDFIEAGKNADFVDTLTLHETANPSLLIGVLGDYVVGISSRETLTTKLGEIMTDYSTQDVQALVQKFDAFFKVHSGGETSVLSASPNENKQPTPAVHTMADDVERVQGYESLYGTPEAEPVHSSSQADLTNPKMATMPEYREKEEVSETPTEPTVEPDTRWSSNL